MLEAACIMFMIYVSLNPAQVFWGCLSLLFILSINIFNFYKKTAGLAVVDCYVDILSNVDTCHD